MQEETINGTALSYWGATMMKGSYASLMKPAETKEWVSNDDPRKNGTDYIVPENVVFKERTVNLIFGIVGDDELDFLAKHFRFISAIQNRICVLYVPTLGRYYHLKYESCTQFDNYSLRACKLAVRFTEPDPSKTEK